MSKCRFGNRDLEHTLHVIGDEEPNEHHQTEIKERQPEGATLIADVDGAYDAHDAMGDASSVDCYGSMQIHLDDVPLLAFNRWSNGGACCGG